MGSERERQTFLACLYDQTERYDEMVTCMKDVAKMDGALTVDERNLLLAAFKNAAGTRRAARRNILSVERMAEEKGSDKDVDTIRMYRNKIEAELERVCLDGIEVLEQSLLPSATSGESNAVYHRMNGDLHRYLAEFASGQKREVAVAAAHDAYKSATDVAQTELAPAHVTRLGVALNFSVFCLEILNSPDSAYRLAKQAFDDAIADLDSLFEESCHTGILIMRLLRDNLTLWASPNAGKAEQAPAETEPESKAKVAQEAKPNPNRSSQDAFNALQLPLCPRA